MIFDVMENGPKYVPAGSRLARAFEFLLNELDPNAPDGRIDVVGDEVFALVQSYPPKPEADCRFEAHRKYIDIQVVLGGAEAMGWAPAEGLKVETPYDAETDVGFFQKPEAYTLLNGLPQMFALFYPHDAHMPQVRIPQSEIVRKVVMKVLVED
ncbi:YhcH/YjgK/YiaL family protein [bacterium]|nr:YhcH/YjgK/YiaL family protein [bacterium]